MGTCLRGNCSEWAIHLPPQRRKLPSLANYEVFSTLTIVQNLVYSGFGHVGGASTHDIKLTTYKGQPHLSYYNGKDLIGGGRGHSIIMDSTYRTAATVHGRAPNDIHEFTVLPGCTAITTVFEPVQYDLSAYGVSQPVGWVLEGIFQEIDIQTGEVLFE